MTGNRLCCFKLFLLICGYKNCIINTDRALNRLSKEMYLKYYKNKLFTWQKLNNGLVSWKNP